MLRSLPRPAYVLIAGVAINRVGSFVQIFLALYVRSKGGSPGEAGLALTIYGIGVVIGILAGGVATDRLSPRTTIVISMISSGAFVGVLPFVHRYGLFFAACACAGAATQLYRPAAMSMLAALTTSDRLVVVSAVYRFGFNVGTVIAPLLGALLISGSYTMIFLLDAGSSIGFGIVALLALTDTHREVGPNTADDRTIAGKDIIKDRRYLIFVAALVAISIVEIQYTSVLPLEIVARGFPELIYSAVVSLNGLLVILAEVPVTSYTARWVTGSAITLGIGLIAAGIATFSIPGLIPLFIATIIWTAGEIIAAPRVAAYPSLIASPRARGRYIAFASGGQNLGYAVGPALGTAIWQSHGTAFWVMCGILGLLATGLSYSSTGPAPRKAHETSVSSGSS